MKRRMGKKTFRVTITVVTDDIGNWSTGPGKQTRRPVRESDVAKAVTEMAGDYGNDDFVIELVGTPVAIEQPKKHEN